MIKATLHSTIPMELANKVNEIAEKHGISLSRALLLVLIEAYKKGAFESAHSMEPTEAIQEIKHSFQDFKKYFGQQE